MKALRAFLRGYVPALLIVRMADWWARHVARWWDIGKRVPAGGVLGENSVAAATAVLGYDLASSTVWQSSSRPRLWRGFAMTGSGAAGDTKVDLMIGGQKVGEKYNTTTGFPTKDHAIPVGKVIPPSEQIHIYVTDAPVTNPINVLVDVVDF